MTHAQPHPSTTEHEAEHDLGAAVTPSVRRKTTADRFAELERRLAEPHVRRRLEIGVPIAVVGLAAVLRLAGLGHTQQLVFDETYYVKEGWSVHQLGYEGEWSDDANERFEAGDPGALSSDPDFVVHPPLGKWIIGMAMAVFGMHDPFFWRLPTAIVGTMLVGTTYAIARGLLGSIGFAALAAGWLAIDGLAIVMSRTGLLDGILALFVLLGAGCMLLDRRGSPLRTVRALHEAPRRFGAAMWSRPWLVLAGLMLGCACATKWSGAYYLAAFGLWTVLLDVLDRRRAGFRRPMLGTLLTQAPASFLLVVVPALAVYVASYAGWFGGGYDADWALEHADERWGGVLAWVPFGLQSLWHYHAQQYGFHVGLTSDHNYESPAFQWLWLGRPTAFELTEVAPGVQSWIIASPNVVTWYSAVIALAFLLFHFGRTLDRRAGFVLAGVVAGYVPWLAFPDRTIFFFYAIVFQPFLYIGLALALAIWAGSGDRSGAWGMAEPRPRARDADAGASAGGTGSIVARERRLTAWLVAGVLVLGSLAAFAWFAPVWFDLPMPTSEVRMRFWPPALP